MKREKLSKYRCPSCGSVSKHQPGLKLSCGGCLLHHTKVVHLVERTKEAVVR